MLPLPVWANKQSNLCLTSDFYLSMLPQNLSIHYPKLLMKLLTWKYYKTNTLEFLLTSDVINVIKIMYFFLK